MYLSGKYKRIAAVCSAFILLFPATDSSFAANAKSDDWPQWRGPNRNGISAEKGILKNWPANGPKVLWRIASGDGYSGMSVANGKLYTAWGDGNWSYLYCFDAATGKQLWQHKLGTNPYIDRGRGPRSTPQVDHNLVFAADGYGKLHAVNATTGELVWRHDLAREYGCRIPTWGYSSSPMVFGNMLIIQVGGQRDHAFIAFEKKSGDMIWHSQTDEPAYSSPIVATIHGTRQIIFFSANGLHAVSPQNGILFWKYRWTTSYDANVANPIFIAPDKIYISSSYGTGAAVVQINERAGRFTAETVWKSRVMKNHFNSAVLIDGYIYGFDDGTLKCIEAESGREMWKTRGFQKGQLIFADGCFIVLGERGQLALIEATPNSYREKTNAQMLRGKCWTMPTLANGKLYIRNQREMLCLDFQEKAK
ncbi:MAG: PQQ-binding-like beta-propeller repeat protein [bacterium]